MSRHLDRERALLAYGCVQEVLNRNGAPDYRAHVRGLPAMIQACGLAQTLAFQRSKKNDEPHATLARHLCMALASSTGACAQLNIPRDPRQALTRLLQLRPSEYRRATVEAMAFLQWLKRFAEAELPDRGGRNA